eukprot:CAMPEP_0196727040 /NCGR_PEP_ID=MMETSP1091-20130531/8122_1 /TAXON_ID=302021 /ORGANISM="Rhodomonas sp., Strain CCMP768" /LENGTH=84 /DNA_ID=CAMNT_0042069565 /DNA_START=1 /DNA_END=252 /DNA_ORIENTATION=-
MEQLSTLCRPLSLTDEELTRLRGASTCGSTSAAAAAQPRLSSFSRCSASQWRGITTGGSDDNEDVCRAGGRERGERKDTGGLLV